MIQLQKDFYSPTRDVNEAEFSAIVRAPHFKVFIDMFRATGDDAWKRKLPAFIFQATFDETPSKMGTMGRWRKQSAARLTGLVVMDIDHVSSPRQTFDGWKNLDFVKLGILFVYITPSGKGLKVVFKADPDKGNLIDNQHAMADVLGVTVDEACKDASRLSFICKEEDILYLDRELFTYENKEFAEKYNEAYRAGNTMPTKKQGVGMKAPATSQLPESSDKGKAFKGIPYSEIIKEWWNQNGGEPHVGARNVSLYHLAVNLRSICDNDPSVLMRILPRYGLDENEMRGIVISACKEPVKGISYAIQNVLNVLENNGMCGNIDRQLETWGEEFDKLFAEYPIMKDICKGLKKNQYPAAVFVAGGLMMTLMTRCTYRFYHRSEELRRLNNSTFIIGDPASGKSFATRLYKLLTGPILAADGEGIKAINAYREEMKTKGANKEKPKKPKAIIRNHPSRTSNAQLIQDMVNAVEVVDGVPMNLHMLTFDTELDNTVSVQKGGSWIDKQSLELKAFHNEEDGQAYSNNDSVFQNFQVYWNFIYTGTPIALKKKVNQKNIGNGLATRLTCIPLPPTNFQMLERESTIDYESDERLKECATRLDRMKGELSVKKIVDALYDWTARRMADAKENNSQADEMLLKRCAYHGLNFAAPFIVLRHWESLHEDGQYWCGTFETDEVDWQLAELLVNIQFACQRHFFGSLAEKYFDCQEHEASVNVKRQQKSILAFERLPEEFTNEDVMRCFNLCSDSAARMRIKRLTDDHLVEQMGTFKENGTTKSRYRKTGVFML